MTFYQGIIPGKTVFLAKKYENFDLTENSVATRTVCNNTVFQSMWYNVYF